MSDRSERTTTPPAPVAATAELRCHGRSTRARPRVPRPWPHHRPQHERSEPNLVRHVNERSERNLVRHVNERSQRNLVDHVNERSERTINTVRFAHWCAGVNERGERNLVDQ
jgi:hypothetical protein